MKIDKVHICNFASEPKEFECYEAIWSFGKECKNCNVTCYRKGWIKSQVDADNKKLVRTKNNEIHKC